MANPISNTPDLRFSKGRTFKFTMCMMVKVGNLDPVPVDLTGAVVHFCAKKTLTDLTPVIDKDSTGGDIVIVSPATNGIVDFTIQSLDTASLAAGQYRYSVWAVLGTGEKQPMVGNGSLFIDDVCEVP